MSIVEQIERAKRHHTMNRYCNPGRVLLGQKEITELQTEFSHLIAMPEGYLISSGQISDMTIYEMDDETYLQVAQ